MKEGSRNKGQVNCSTKFPPLWVIKRRPRHFLPKSSFPPTHCVVNLLGLVPLYISSSFVVSPRTTPRLSHTSWSKLCNSYFSSCLTILFPDILTVFQRNYFTSWDQIVWPFLSNYFSVKTWISPEDMASAAGLSVIFAFCSYSFSKKI